MRLSQAAAAIHAQVSSVASPLIHWPRNSCSKTTGLGSRLSNPVRHPAFLLRRLLFLRVKPVALRSALLEIFALKLNRRMPNSKALR
jgi:hypothetical protein